MAPVHRFVADLTCPPPDDGPDFFCGVTLHLRISLDIPGLVELINTFSIRCYHVRVFLVRRVSWGYFVSRRTWLMSVS